MDPSSLWDWGCGPRIFMGWGLAPLSPGGGSGSTVPASLHLTEGSAHPLQPGPGSGRRGEEMPLVAQGSLSGMAFLLSTFPTDSAEIPN